MAREILKSCKRSTFGSNSVFECSLVSGSVKPLMYGRTTKSSCKSTGSAYQGHVFFKLTAV